MSGGPSHRRRLVWAFLVNGAASLVTWAVFLALRPRFGQPEGVSSLAERLAWGLGLAVWPAALLLAMVVAVALARAAADAFDPVRDPETPVLAVSRRVLTNSVEQTAIFVPTLLALAASLEDRHLGALVLLLALFLAGRLLFWAGYLVHSFARAPGMAMTLNVNAGMVAFALWRGLVG